jgi:hypothetical protein
MSIKNWIRVVVLTGILAWPGVETYRYCVALGQQDVALQRQQRVALVLAQTKTAQVARPQRDEAAVPVANPEVGTPKSPSSL